MTKEKEIYDKVVCMLHSRLDDFDALPTSEVGEIVDIIKDMAQARYYMSMVHEDTATTTSTYTPSLMRDLEVRG